MTRFSALVVEDDAGLRDSLSLLVAREGYDVRHAGSRKEARRLLSESYADVVLLDLGLPGVRGEVVLARLRETRPVLPVIVITGNDTELAQRLLADGAFDYLAKPFSMSRLAHVLEAALASRR
jgi:two-component system, NtrC family, C4-dicarboxylate transport response regulator DctD